MTNAQMMICFAVTWVLPLLVCAIYAHREHMDEQERITRELDAYFRGYHDGRYGKECERDDRH